MRADWYAEEDKDGYWSLYRRGRIIAHNVKSEADIRKKIRKRDELGTPCLLIPQEGERRSIHA